MLATQLNSLVEEERLSAHCVCQVNRFIVNSLKDGRYFCLFRYLCSQNWLKERVKGRSSSASFRGKWTGVSRGFS